MLLCNARDNSQGFTLLETMMTIIVIGILSAIAAPSFLGMLNRNRVNSALNDIQGALQQAQREAMRKSISCKVNLDSNTVTSDSSNSSNCLVTGNRTLPDGVVMVTNISGTPPQINFSYRGTITLPDAGTIVLSSKDNPNLKKCLVISSPLGIIRTGNYNDSTTSSITYDKCKKN